jgi:uncharacterized membrane protein
MSDLWRLGRRVGKILFAALFLAVGVSHFTRTELLMTFMPPYLPLHRELVLISGVCEIALGILLLVPRTSRLAAWGLIALLIAVFPANLYMYQHAEQFPYPKTGLLIRLPMQALLILWAFAYTRQPREVRASTTDGP